MPIYSYICEKHGRFDKIQNLGDDGAQCPRCNNLGQRIPTTPARITIQTKERLPFGSGSRGRYVSSIETGGLPIFVPSWGALEKAEVDYLADAAIDKEKERVRKKREYVRQDKERISKYMKLAYETKPGQRAKTVREAMKEVGDLAE